MSALRAALLAHERWAAAAGPWRRWMQDVPLLAPFDAIDDVRPVKHLDPLARRIAGASAAPARSAPTLVVLDVNAASGVQAAAALAELSAAHPVLFLGRWPYREAVLAGGRLRSLLVARAQQLPPAMAAPSVAVVLDGERDRPLPGRAALDRRVDNRYETSVDDLPDLPALAAAGIGRVLVVSGSSPERVLFATEIERRYQAGGLVVERRIVA